MNVLAWILTALFRIFGFRRRLVRENLARAFPNLSPAELHELEQKNYVHYGRLFAQFFWSFGGGFDKYLRKNCVIEGEEHLRAALAEGKGVLLLTAHLGNWELLPAVTSKFLKVPVTIVTKLLKPAWLHARVEKARAKLGTRMAYEPSTLRIVLRALRQNEMVCFAVDQFAGAPLGARVPFFGIPVGTHTALAVIALRTGAPVVAGFTVREAGGVWRVRFFPAFPSTPVEVDPAGDTAQNQQIIYDTARYSAFIESWVRRYPDQWLWIHRRWKGDLSPLPKGRVGEMMKPD